MKVTFNFGSFLSARSVVGDTMHELGEKHNNVWAFDRRYRRRAESTLKRTSRTDISMSALRNKTWPASPPVWLWKAISPSSRA